MTQNVLHHLFMEGLEQETARPKTAPESKTNPKETPESKAKAEIHRLIDKEKIKTRQPIQKAIKNMTFDATTKASCIANLNTIGYDELSLKTSDFYIKKALLLEGIKGYETYGSATIGRLIGDFDKREKEKGKNGTRALSPEQMKLVQFYLYQNGFYSSEYITSKQVSIFDACDGVVGPNTRLAMSNFKKGLTPSESVIATIEGQMTRDSIRVFQPVPSSPMLLPPLIKQDSNPTILGPVLQPTPVTASPNFTGYQNQLNVLKGQFSDVFYVFLNKIKSKYTNRYKDLLTAKAERFLQYLAKNNLLDIKDQFAKQGLAKNTNYKNFLNMIEQLSGLPKNALYGIMMTECKGRKESNGQYIGPFHQGETFGAAEYRSDPIRSALFAAASLHGGYFDKLKTGSHDIYSFAHAARNYNGNADNKRSYPGKVLYYMGCMDDTPNKEDVRFLSHQYLKGRVDYGEWIASNGGDANFVGFGKPWRPADVETFPTNSSLYIGDSLTRGYGSGNDLSVLAYPGQESYDIMTQAGSKLALSTYPNVVAMSGMNDALRLATKKANDAEVDTWLDNYIYNIQTYVVSPAYAKNVFLCTVPLHTKGTLVSKELTAIIQKLNARIQQFCSQNPSIKLIDTYNYVRGLAAGGEVVYQRDGIHLARGADYQKMKAYVNFCVGKTKASGAPQLIAAM